MAKILVKREIFPQIIEHLKAKEITVITGARQTGKTTLLFQIKDYLIQKQKINSEKIKIFNLDLISDLEGLKSQTDFIKFLKEELERKKNLFVFIDEVQRLENPGKFLKGIYDLMLPVKFIVTGSSSLEIRSKIFESLTGRKRVFHLYPFSFSEFFSFYNPTLFDLLYKKDISSLHKRAILDYFYDFIIYGGYPKIALEKNKEQKIQILKEIYSSYIERDIMGFIKVKNPLSFSKLVNLLAAQTGQLVNFKEISSTLKINYRTLENYLNILEKTFIIVFLRPFFTNVRKELSKMPKIYFIDNGLRNFALKSFTPFLENRDRGSLLENFVFSSFLKIWDGPIHFWRTKDRSEVDFILKDYWGNIIPVEVKAQEISKSFLTRGFLSFIKAYRPKRGFIVNLSLKDKIKFNSTQIEFIYPYEVKRVFEEIQVKNKKF